MVEVYKTDVKETTLAKKILKEIQKLLPSSNPSFDLEDCDNVLRVEHPSDNIIEKDIRKILANYGHNMEILL